jgi:hypothetical protein
MILSNILLFAADDVPLWGKALVIVFAVLLFILMLIGLALVIRDSIRRRGKWGFNGAPTFCPNCGEPAPTVRKPANYQQAAWGGWTCKECGCQFDKWGRRIFCPKCAVKLPEVARPKQGSAVNKVRGSCAGCGHESTLFRLTIAQYDDE